MILKIVIKIFSYGTYFLPLNSRYWKKILENMTKRAGGLSAIRYMVINHIKHCF